MSTSREFVNHFQGIVWSFGFLAVCLGEGSLFLAKFSLLLLLFG